MLRLGLDVGSTTVKIIVMNEDLETIYTDYQRHFSDTKNTICNVLDNLLKTNHKNCFTYSTVKSVACFM